jgi:GTPase SAR1 family protein
MGFIFSKFFSKKLELCILGLEGCGKTTFVNQLTGEVKKTAPTIGLNVKSYKKGLVNMKIWDIGGQFQYRQNWIDYAKLCDVIVFIVDAANVRI